MTNFKCPWTQYRLAIFLLLFVSSTGATPPAKEKTKYVQNLLATDSVALGIMENPEYVEICFLELKDVASGNDRHYVERPSKKMSQDFADFFLVKFTQDYYYLWDSVSLCLPEYNVRYKFWREGHVVAIDVCYGCEQVLFSRDGKPFAETQFGKGAEWTLQALEHQFADDKDFRKLRKRLDTARQEKFEQEIEISKAILSERRYPRS